MPLLASLGRHHICSSLEGFNGFAETRPVIVFEQLAARKLEEKFA